MSKRRARSNSGDYIFRSRSRSVRQRRQSPSEEGEEQEYEPLMPYSPEYDPFQGNSVEREYVSAMNRAREQDVPEYLRRLADSERALEREMEESERLRKEQEDLRERAKEIVRVAKERGREPAAGGGGCGGNLPLVSSPSQIARMNRESVVELLQGIEGSNRTQFSPISAANPVHLSMLAAAAYYIGTQSKNIEKLDKVIAPLRKYLFKNFSVVLGTTARPIVEWIMAVVFMALKTVAKIERQSLANAAGGDIVHIVFQCYTIYSILTLTNQSTNVLSLIKKLPGMENFESVQKLIREFYDETSQICKFSVGGLAQAARAVKARVCELGECFEDGFSLLRELLGRSMGIEDVTEGMSTDSSTVRSASPEQAIAMAAGIADGILEEVPLVGDAAAAAAAPVSVNLQINSDGKISTASTISMGSLDGGRNKRSRKGRKDGKGRKGGKKRTTKNNNKNKKNKKNNKNFIQAVAYDTEHLTPKKFAKLQFQV
jgi:hypothetical protein